MLGFVQNKWILSVLAGPPRGLGAVCGGGGVDVWKRKAPVVPRFLASPFLELLPG